MFVVENLDRQYPVVEQDNGGILHSRRIEKDLNCLKVLTIEGPKQTDRTRCATRAVDGNKSEAPVGQSQNIRIDEALEHLSVDGNGAQVNKPPFLIGGVVKYVVRGGHRPNVCDAVDHQAVSDRVPLTEELLVDDHIANNSSNPQLVVSDPRLETR